MGGAKKFQDVPLPGLGALGGDTQVSPPKRRVDPTLRPTEAARAAFWRRIVKAPGDGCWIFIGAISSPDGYGRIAWRSHGRERTLSAHRFALEVAHGRLEPWVVAEHKCNEPLCVRVGAGHVVRSTQRDNLAYAVALGRATGQGTLGASADRVARSVAVRAAVKDGWNQKVYETARNTLTSRPLPQPALFDM